MRARFFFILILIAATSAAAATTIVSYTFEDTLTPVTGAGISSISWNSGGAEGYATQFSGFGKALSVSSFQMGEYYDITLDATGFTGIALNDFRANGGISAPLNWKLAYSTTGAGGSFTDVATFTMSSLTGVGSTTVAGFLLPGAADDNADIVVRFMATSSTRVDNAVGTANGTVRLDNISFTATAIPEPSAWAVLLGLAALMGVAWAQRQKN